MGDLAIEVGIALNAFEWKPTTETEVFLAEIDAQRPLGKLQTETGNRHKRK
jgi:hypothetical protein